MVAEAGGPQADRYRQGVAALDLFIERWTDRVPADGRYHVVVAGNVVGSFRSLRGAQHCYRRQQDVLGFVPAPAPSGTAAERLRREDLERDLLRSASFWAESHKYSSGGGRLRHR
jgi:hypothetical protein